jgi:uncharacterized membrane protein YphA (DoxX/SURF4 family)
MSSSTNIPAHVSAALLTFGSLARWRFSTTAAGFCSGRSSDPARWDLPPSSTHRLSLDIWWALLSLPGGLAILTGALIRIGAICIIVVMLGALMVHLPHGYDITKDGAEYVITQLFIALAILIAGGGAFRWGPHYRDPCRIYSF